MKSCLVEVKYTSVGKLGFKSYQQQGGERPFFFRYLLSVQAYSYHHFVGGVNI
jgi:hypothetical protein